MDNYVNYIEKDELYNINKQNIQCKDLLGEEFKQYFAVINLELEEKIYILKIEVFKNNKNISESKIVLGEDI